MYTYNKLIELTKLHLEEKPTCLKKAWVNSADADGLWKTKTGHWVISIEGLSVCTTIISDQVSPLTYWPALRLLLQTQLNQVVQGDLVVFGRGALRSVGRWSGGTMRQASGGDALPDARVHSGARHLQTAQLAQWEGSHVQQAAVGAAQLLKQHLDREIQTLTQTADNSQYFMIYNLGGKVSLPEWGACPGKGPCRWPAHRPRCPNCRCLTSLRNRADPTGRADWRDKNQWNNGETD